MMFFLISSSFLIQKFAILVFMVECQVIVGAFFFHLTEPSMGLSVGLDRVCIAFSKHGSISFII